MQSRQIILANEPRLLRSLFYHALVKIPELEIAGEVTSVAGLPAILDHTEAQWVIVALSAEGEIPHDVESLLAQYSAIGVVGIAADGSAVEIRGAGNPNRIVSTYWSLDELVTTLCQQRTLVPDQGV